MDGETLAIIGYKTPHIPGIDARIFSTANCGSFTAARRASSRPPMGGGCLTNIVESRTYHAQKTVFVLSQRHLEHKYLDEAWS
jgi:hypothetical protein